MPVGGTTGGTTGGGPVSHSQLNGGVPGVLWKFGSTSFEFRQTNLNLPAYILQIAVSSAPHGGGGKHGGETGGTTLVGGGSTTGGIIRQWQSKWSDPALGIWLGGSTHMNL
eukprot:630189_1